MSAYLDEALLLMALMFRQKALVVEMLQEQEKQNPCQQV